MCCIFYLKGAGELEQEAENCSSSSVHPTENQFWIQSDASDSRFTPGVGRWSSMTTESHPQLSLTLGPVTFWFPVDWSVETSVWPSENTWCSAADGCWPSHSHQSSFSLTVTNRHWLTHCSRSSAATENWILWKDQRLSKKLQWRHTWLQSLSSPDSVHTDAFICQRLVSCHIRLHHLLRRQLLDWKLLVKPEIWISHMLLHSNTF